MIRGYSTLTVAEWVRWEWIEVTGFTSAEPEYANATPRTPDEQAEVLAQLRQVNPRCHGSDLIADIVMTT